MCRVLSSSGQPTVASRFQCFQHPSFSRLGWHHGEYIAYQGGGEAGGRATTQRAPGEGKAGGKPWWAPPDRGRRLLNIQLLCSAHEANVTDWPAGIPRGFFRGLFYPG